MVPGQFGLAFALQLNSTSVVGGGNYAGLADLNPVVGVGVIWSDNANPSLAIYPPGDTFLTQLSYSDPNVHTVSVRYSVLINPPILVGYLDDVMIFNVSYNATQYLQGNLVYSGFR